MKALSIMQPWAWLITNGHKDIENRTWKSWNTGLSFRGKCLVHAGKKVDGGKRQYADLCDDILDGHNIQLPCYDDLELGGIVGIMNIANCVKQSPSPWFFGEYGFVIDRAKPLPFMPYIGQLGFFDAEYDKKLLTDTP